MRRLITEISNIDKRVFHLGFYYNPDLKMVFMRINSRFNPVTLDDLEEFGAIFKKTDEYEDRIFYTIKPHNINTHTVTDDFINHCYRTVIEADRKSRKVYCFTL